MCVHGRQRTRCAECFSADKMLRGNSFCHICLTNRLSTPRRRAKLHVCAQCSTETPDRIEIVVRPLLLSLVNHPPSAQDDTMFGMTCDVVRRRRPDLLWLGKDRAVICECDENGGHGRGNYTPECDLGWIMDMNAALVALNGGRLINLYVIRWNPDGSDTTKLCLDDRVAHVASRVNHFNAMDLCDADPRRPTVEYHFYHTKCWRHIEYALEQQGAITVSMAGTPPIA